ncbi:Alpha/Beta hydrolase protein [Spinellus fusiger]|nr:Alpha/Beta hydrolase protein [Spinellus fusiger]
MSSLFMNGMYILYAFQVSISSVFVLFCLRKSLVVSLLETKLPIHIHHERIESLCSLVAEHPLHIFFLKVILSKLLGSVVYISWFSLLMWLDISTLFGLGILLYEGFYEPIYARGDIYHLRGNSVAPEVLFCLNSLIQLINPFWSSPDIVVYPSITYATNEEIRDAREKVNSESPLHQMVMNIYTQHKHKPVSRPVLVHLHGDAWQSRFKDTLQPYEKMLVTEKNWVIVNVGYQLGPSVHFSDQLINVKCALRWIKQCIHIFGGNPNCIVLSGASTGGYLASMTSLTTNDPIYQPEFESQDTSVCGVISVNGIMDLERKPTYLVEHSKVMAQETEASLPQVPSLYSLMKNREKNTTLVPFLMIGSGRDTLVDTCEIRKFKMTYDKASETEKKASQCSVLTVPNAHHFAFRNWSPRSIQMSCIITHWCQHIVSERLAEHA